MPLRLKEAREAYYDYSRKASEINRQLGFAGIALIWVFRIEGPQRTQLPPNLLLAATVIFISLALDLLQYVIGTLTWGLYSRYHERRGVSEARDLAAPRWINWTTLALFWTKMAAMCIVYGVLIIPFLIRTLS